MNVCWRLPGLKGQENRPPQQRANGNAQLLPQHLEIEPLSHGSRLYQMDSSSQSVLQSCTFQVPGRESYSHPSTRSQCECRAENNVLQLTFWTRQREKCAGVTRTVV